MGRPRGSDKQREADALISVGVPEAEALRQVGYDNWQRELHRRRTRLLKYGGTDVAKLSLDTLRAHVKSNDPQVAMAAASGLLTHFGQKRSAASDASVQVVIVGAGSRFDQPMPADPLYAGTAEELLAQLEHLRAANNEAPSELNADRELAVAALVRIISSNSRRTPLKTISAARELLKQVPEKVDAGARTVFVLPFGPRGPVPPNTRVVFLRGVTTDEALTAIHGVERAS